MYIHKALIFISTIIATACAAQPDVDQPTNVLAVSVETFLTSLGVNTHVDQGYNPLTYIDPLKYLGVRNIRDSGRNVQGLLMLHARAGVKVDLLGGDVDTLLRNARNLAAADALLAVEGPNEPNNFPITYKGQKGGGPIGPWLPVAELQRDLYAAVKQDPLLARTPVFHVSEGGAETENVGLQFLTIPPDARTLLPAGTRFADFANPHNYVSAVHGGYHDNQAWQAASPTLNDRWDGLYVEYGRTWKHKYEGYSNEDLEKLPRVTTETGWDAATPADERTQGIVLVNTYLAQFKRGWRYTFIYELGEGEGGGGHQGLFHQDWTPKLAADYIHNLTAILADGAPLPAQVPASMLRLAYRLEGASDTVHDLLLQKSDGTFELVVWGEQVAGDTALKVRFPRAPAQIKIYDVTAGTDPIATYARAAEVALKVTDHALILELR